MNLTDFSRILILLRKEKGISQKQAAKDLGVSQSLLSHYEKGIRECGLVFLVRAADYYGVTTDFLLGRSYEKNGTTISVEDIPDDDASAKGNVGVKNMLTTLNKKLICNSVSVIMDTLSEVNDKHLTNEVSAYLNVSIYKIIRMLYNSNPDNPQTLFGADKKCFSYMSDAALNSSQALIQELLDKNSDNGINNLILDRETIEKRYPMFSSSLFNLLQTAETRIGARKK